MSLRPHSSFPFLPRSASSLSYGSRAVRSCSRFRISQQSPRPILRRGTAGPRFPRYVYELHVKMWPEHGAGNVVDREREREREREPAISSVDEICTRDVSTIMERSCGDWKIILIRCYVGSDCSTQSRGFETRITSSIISGSMSAGGKSKSKNSCHLFNTLSPPLSRGKLCPVSFARKNSNRRTYRANGRRRLLVSRDVARFVLQERTLSRSLLSCRRISGNAVSNGATNCAIWQAFVRDGARIVIGDARL